MGLVTAKIAEQVFSPAPKEIFLGSVSDQLGASWTQFRIAMFLSGENHVIENDPGSTESFAVADTGDMFAIGLKDSDITTLPGDADSLFIGVTSGPATSKATTSAFGDSAGNMFAGGYNGVTPIGFSGALTNGGIKFPVDPSLASSYNGMYAILITVIDRGLATQNISISAMRSASVSGVDYSKAKLTNLLANGVYGTAKNFVWNVAGVPLTIPDHVFIRAPYYFNRPRIQTLMTSKLS